MTASPTFIVNLLQILGIVTAMMLLNWRLAILVLIPIPLILWLMNKAFPRLWRLFSRRWRALRGLNSVVNDALTGSGSSRPLAKRGRRSSGSPGVMTVSQRSLQTGYFTSALFPLLGLLIMPAG